VTDFLPFSRRRALVAAAAVLASAAPVLAQRKGDAPNQVSVDDLMKPGNLPDMVLGTADAPVTIVEYASMTCGHCAAFHNTVFPKLKEKYVDTGKVRFILREFPLDNLAAAAAMLTRCAGGDKSYPLVTALFAKQEEWAFVRSNPVPELLKFARQAGFTEESFNKCLTDQKLLDDVTAQRERASKVFGVNATPTFFVNGKRLGGGARLDDFDKAIAAAQPKSAG
jgi:protein-disulfide isomerase